MCDVINNKPDDVPTVIVFGGLEQTIVLVEVETSGAVVVQRTSHESRSDWRNLEIKITFLKRLK